MGEISLRNRLLTLISFIILGSGLLFGGGTYAFMSASAANDGNQFGDFQAETLNIQSLMASNTTSGFQPRALYSRGTTGQVDLPMFYGHAGYPTGLNPYDYRTSSSFSGEIEGGWAPGDEVRRFWAIQNSGAASKITNIYAPVDKFSLTDKYGNVVSSGSQVYKDFLSHMRIAIYYPQGTPVYTGNFQQLLQAPQPLDIVICLSKGSTTTVTFVASMDLNAGNDLQGVKGILDFELGAEQVKNNSFDPPFSNIDYSMKIGSTTPIKFEVYDTEGNLSTSSKNVSLVITGPRLGGGILTLTYNTENNDLTCNGGHYQASVYADPKLFIEGGTYIASVYNDFKMYGQKAYNTYPGNRSNAP